jgi:hypothetical protein
LNLIKILVIKNQAFGCKAGKMARLERVDHRFSTAFAQKM